jgi:hypothetical protein
VLVMLQQNPRMEVRLPLGVERFCFVKKPRRYAKMR